MHFKAAPFSNDALLVVDLRTLPLELWEASSEFGLVLDPWPHWLVFSRDHFQRSRRHHFQLKFLQFSYSLQMNFKKLHSIWLCKRRTTNLFDYHSKQLRAKACFHVNRWHRHLRHRRFRFVPVSNCLKFQVKLLQCNLTPFSEEKMCVFFTSACGQMKSSATISAQPFSARNSIQDHIEKAFGKLAFHIFCNTC